ncbi:MAG TPA: hypothetical protein VMS77_06605 [Conexivisphaerales archaeon]|nr:hypothetical protein [Conexivisphaerales archaeon]
MTKDKEFENRVTKCFDISLDRLGTGVRDVVYRYLKLTSGIERTAIVDNPDEFMRALTEIFGMGAHYIERMATEAIEEEFDLGPTPRDLVNAVPKAKAER